MKDRHWEFDNVLSRLENLEYRGDYAKAKCPAHEDNQNSLSLKVGKNGSLLMKCHAGCDVKNVLAQLNLEFKDLWPNNDTPSKPSAQWHAIPHKPAQTKAKANKKPSSVPKKIVATYDYLDENGKLLFQTVRYDPKDFRQRQPDGNGGWIWNLKGVETTLYRWCEVVRFLKEQPERKKASRSVRRWAKLTRNSIRLR